MNVQITFGPPKDVGPNDLDGVVLRFPFILRRLDEGALRDTESEHSVDVKISGTLSAIWRLGARGNALENTALVKTLFEYARIDVITRMKAGNLPERYQIELNTGVAPKDNPFDPAKIPNPTGFAIRWTLAEEAPAKSNPPTSGAPKVFISYSWDSDSHKTWVRDLSARLRSNGVDVTLDQWHLAPGDQLPEFMERAVRENDLILIVCTPHYKDKSDARKGGVGYEGDIMTAEIFAKGNHRKFIPILRDGAWDKAAPSWLLGKYRIDLRGDPYFEEQFGDLVLTIHSQRPQAPPLGNPPSVQSSSGQTNKPSVTPTKPDDPIRIEGIVADEVSMPTLDGRMRSGLYSIPFRLSRAPSGDWTTVFIHTWDHPPSYSNMHRPGIARVVGNKVILTGTTIEEVEKHHRATLLLAVAAANTADAAIRADRLLKEEQAEELKRKHQEKIQEAAKKLRFD